MNDFDFFTVSASSSSIRSLMQLPNVKRENIETRVYYGGKYPKSFYKVHLKFFDAMEVGHYVARQMADKFVNGIVGTKPDNVILSVKFESRD
jgi:alkyl sulfatase BDS1-like metallo-beta-lactamase superfamily hydrolase